MISKIHIENCHFIVGSLIEFIFWLNLSSAESVSVSGEFSQWKPLTMSHAEKDLWKIKLKLKKGSHLLKFIVNGCDSVSDYMEKVLIDGRTYNIFQLESHSY